MSQSGEAGFYFIIIIYVDVLDEMGIVYTSLTRIQAFNSAVPGSHLSVETV